MAKHVGHAMGTSVMTPWHVVNNVYEGAHSHGRAPRSSGFSTASRTELVRFALAHDIKGLLRLLGWREPLETLASG